MCEDCKYCEYDTSDVPCNTCIIWVDGYLDYSNYEYKYLKG